MKSTILAGTLAIATTATCVLALAPGASAAPQACVSTGLTTGQSGAVGTIAYKSSTSSCNDLNLTYSDDANGTWDYYAGRLRNSNGTWFTCAKGYVYAADGSHSLTDSTYTLCTDVNDNVAFGVASAYDGFDTVTITH
ncbi:hypothetical protein [Streptomyces sp. NPDC127072]|uniref:hypothetical protein n=1 Tax=Streptomyces sp. NPDC127072 TaxID=3347129 RepID=UPI00364803B3